MSSFRLLLLLLLLDWKVKRFRELVSVSSEEVQCGAELRSHFPSIASGDMAGLLISDLSKDSNPCQLSTVTRKQTARLNADSFLRVHHAYIPTLDRALGTVFPNL